MTARQAPGLCVGPPTPAAWRWGAAVCVVAGDHADDCPAPTDCPGCLRSTAEEGTRLCKACTGRVLAVLTEQPSPSVTLTAWMAAHVAVPTSRADHGHVASRDGTPAPIRPGVVDWLTDWTRTLTGWTAAVADLAGLHGPGAADPEACRAWLTAQLRHVTSTDLTADLTAELLPLLDRAHALAPWREARSVARAVPCTCVLHSGGLDRRSPPPLTIHAIDDGDLRCLRCGRRWTAEDYGRWAGLVAAAARRVPSPRTAPATEGAQRS